MSYHRSPDSRHSKSKHRDRSRSRSRSPSRSERRRSRERQRKSRWYEHDDRWSDHREEKSKESRSSRRSRFSDRDEDRQDDREYDRDGRDRDRKRDRYEDDNHSYSNRNTEEDSKSKQQQLSSVTPGPILMLRNLASYIQKEHLTQALGQQMSYIKDIRLINGRDSTNNYAFVEFYTTDDATNWMEANKNGFEVRGCHINVDFSHHRSMDGDRRRKEFKYSDWNCFKCGTLNFSRRVVCLTCECTRVESDTMHEDRRAGLVTELEAEEDVSKSNPPSNVLMFRGLDSMSTEEDIQKAISDVSNITIKDIRLIKDKTTNTSRRFCFVETITTEEASELFKLLMEQRPVFCIDKRKINISYARVNSSIQSKPANAVAAAAILQAQAMNMGTKATWAQNQQLLQQQYYQKTTSGSTDSTTAQTTATSTAGESTATSLPSTYLYDATSGFYYDSITRLYYDPKTQYHYNSQTGQYCYYDSTKHAYIPVTAEGDPILDTAAQPTGVPATKENKKKTELASMTTGRSAKKIAKDMERWAKSVNTQKAIQQHLINQIVQSPPIQQEVLPLETAAHMPIAQSGNNVSHNEIVPFGVQENDVPNTTKHSMYVQAADEDMPPVGRRGDMEFVDLSQMACLLCKRKFSGREQLMKHIQLSDLHKQNLEKLKQETTGDQLSYRDRASERRAKYGTDAIVPGWKKRFERERAKNVNDEPDRVSAATHEPESENVGSKMLKAMGWNEGQGLGKEGQGIIKPIEAEQRTPSAGLGAPGSNYGIYSSGSDYRTTLKSLTKARYDQMFDD